MLHLFLHRHRRHTISNQLQCRLLPGPRGPDSRQHCLENLTSPCKTLLLLLFLFLTLISNMPEQRNLHPLVPITILPTLRKGKTPPVKLPLLSSPMVTFAFMLKSLLYPDQRFHCLLLGILLPQGKITIIPWKMNNFPPPTLISNTNSGTDLVSVRVYFNLCYFQISLYGL